MTNTLKTLLLPLLALFAFAACKKDAHSGNNGQYFPLDASFKQHFVFKPGSYWIYRDSVTGQTDSAYVTTADSTAVFTGGCVIMNDDRREYWTINICVNSGNTADTDHWTMNLHDTVCMMSMNTNHDTIENAFSCRLFTYPFKLENNSNFVGCVLPQCPDSGNVAALIPQLTLGSQNYTNAARSDHASWTVNNLNITYNNHFYVNPDAGILKIAFDHTQAATRRVLELQHCKIVH